MYQNHATIRNSYFLNWNFKTQNLHSLNFHFFFRRIPPKECNSKNGPTRSSDRVNFSKEVSDEAYGSKKYYNKTPVPLHKSSSLSTETCRSSYHGSVTTASKEAPPQETPRKYTPSKRDPSGSGPAEMPPTLAMGKVSHVPKGQTGRAVDPHVLTQELLQLQLDKIKKTNYILLQRASAHKQQTEKSQGRLKVIHRI